MLKVKLSGGDKLLTKLEKMKKMKDRTILSVGFFPKSKYENGTYVASVAYWNEYGTKRIPPRPFFRTAILENKGKWKDHFYNSVSKIGLQGGIKSLGELVIKDVKQSILSWSTPPNAPSTIKHKGFNNPLIDTFKMVNSVDMEIK